jgi:hypothetical protein
VAREAFRGLLFIRVLEAIGVVKKTLEMGNCVHWSHQPFLRGEKARGNPVLPLAVVSEGHLANSSIWTLARSSASSDVNRPNFTPLVGFSLLPAA